MKRCLAWAWRSPTFLLLAVTVCGCGHHARETLRVATLSLAHGRGASVNPIGQMSLSRQAIEKNLTEVAQALKREAPDVIALQEADAPSDWSGGFDHVMFVADAAGFPHRHHRLHVDLERLGFGLHYGMALLARRELTNVDSYAFRVGPTDKKRRKKKKKGDITDS